MATVKVPWLTSDCLHVYTACIYKNEIVVNAPRKSRTFKSGNSVALRLPKSLGIEAGVEMTVREERGRFIVEPVKAEPRKIDISGFAGTMPWLKPLTSKDREFEERELDWDLLKLPRDD